MAKTNITNSKDVDNYLAALPLDKRAALEKLRSIIKSAAPKADEVITYQVPGFRYYGGLVSYGAAEKHLSFFVMSPVVMDSFKSELKSYDTSKGTIRYPADKPLPASLVKKIVKARIAENETLRKNNSKAIR